MSQKHINFMFRQLLKQPKYSFPPKGKTLKVPEEHAVYVIWDPQDRVAQVGRTYNRATGLKGRLGDHLSGRSSFYRKYIKPNGFDLRSDFKFQYVLVSDSKYRALLEYYATALHSPLYLPLNEGKDS